MDTWLALVLIVFGFAGVVYATRVEPDSTLANLPVLIAALIGGSAAAIIGMILLGIAFSKGL